MKKLRKSIQQIKQYQTIYCHLPFAGMTLYETINIPFWRLFANDCVVFINTQYQHADIAFELIKAWDCRYLTMRRIRRHEPNPILICTKGKAEDIWGLKTINWEPEGASIWKVANTLGSPRLRINYSNSAGHSHFRGWDYCPPTGNHIVDPYIYPLRRNGLDIEYSLSDLLTAVKQEERNRRFASWKILQHCATMLLTCKLSIKDIKDLLRESTGISYFTAQEYVNLIRRIQRGDYGDGIPYTDDIKDHLFRK